MDGPNASSDAADGPRQPSTNPLPDSAGATQGGPVAQHFDMAADSDDEGQEDTCVGGGGGSEHTLSPGDAGTTASSTRDHDAQGSRANPDARPKLDELALKEEVRGRLQFLSSEHQQTVCRQECEAAQKREEALLRQLQTTIDRYSHALEVSNAVVAAVSSGACTDSQVASAAFDGSSSPMGLTPEVAGGYQARIRLLQEVVSTVKAEPLVCLPRLTPLEQAKGLAFASFAKTAQAATKLKDNPSVTPVLGGVQGAFASFTSRFRAATAGAGAGVGANAGVGALDGGDADAPVRAGGSAGGAH